MCTIDDENDSSTSVNSIHVYKKNCLWIIIP